eukprot:TRINITY_DN17527_c0_g1_i1.p1 TRINITY_DN17527_c0_g1~~TRINITY_DN17527_c0_g1_i1.p1  ORF type:complete len:457 (-),score=42.00 TRINITY_DN17527_c0_g1_i1:903-2111(-)
MCCSTQHGGRGNAACWDDVFTFESCCMGAAATTTSLFPSGYEYKNATSFSLWHCFNARDCHWLWSLTNALSFLQVRLLDLKMCLTQTNEALMASCRQLGWSFDFAHKNLLELSSQFLAKTGAQFEFVSDTPYKVTKVMGKSLSELVYQFQQDVVRPLLTLAAMFPVATQDGRQLVEETVEKTINSLEGIALQQPYMLQVAHWFAFGRYLSDRVTSARFHLNIGVTRGEVLTHLVQSLRARDSASTIRLVEIGTRFADTALHLLDADPLLEWIGIDAHPGAEEWAKKLLSRHLESGRASFMCRYSQDVTAQEIPYGSADIIFVDAAHNRASVQLDLAAWTPRVKVNGIVAGHDYGNDAMPDVAQVVNSMLPVGTTLHMAPDHVYWFYVDNRSSMGGLEADSLL